MWMVVGLGNPGPKYAMHRHNVGFLALDAYCVSVGGPRWKDEKKSEVVKLKLDADDVLFVKPQDFMNRSGESVRALMDYYKIELNHLIVIHDDIDQGFGALRIHKNRGAGGHNGLKSINEMLGTQDYIRIKMGVGRPTHPGMEVADYVLQNFSGDEQKHLHDFLSVAGDAMDALITQGYDRAATKFTRNALVLTPPA